MNEPRRLLAVGSPRARALLHAARREAPASSLVPAVIGTLGVASAMSAPSVATKLLASLRQAALSKLGVGMVAVATASSGGYLVGRLHERTLHAEATQTPIAVVEAQPAEPVPAPRPVVKATEPPAVTATPAPHVVPSARRPMRPSIVGELDEIRHARALVVGGNGAQALEALDAYQLSHPKGTFQEEALALRIRALRLTSDFIGAERSLRELKSRFPSSIYLAGLDP